MQSTNTTSAILLIGNKLWTLPKHDLFFCFEKKILCSIFKVVLINGEWRWTYNFELYQLYKEHNKLYYNKLTQPTKMDWLYCKEVER